MYYSSGNYEAFARARPRTPRRSTPGWSAAASRPWPQRSPSSATPPGRARTSRSSRRAASPAARSTASTSRRRASSSALAVRWRTISSACGTASAPSPAWRSTARPCSTSSTGSTRTTRTTRCSGRVVTGGVVTVKDSSWLMSWTVNRQPHFKKQPKDQIVVWVYSLFVDTPGDYVKKPMSECTGEEITAEWLYHLGVPEADIPELAAMGAKCVPGMMPYVTSFFMPRKAGDRPNVVPDGAQNFAFIGQFAETSRDCIFTTEYSVRTGTEAVYELFDVERGVPEVFNSTCDVRTLLEASSRLKDGEKTQLPGPAVLRRRIAKGLDATEIGVLLREHGVL